MKMKLLNLADKILIKLGLVRESVHKSKMESWETYSHCLGVAAKEKGVKVVFNDTTLDGVLIDTDLFILGKNNVIKNCTLTSCITAFAPSSMNYFLNNIIKNDSIKEI